MIVPAAIAAGLTATGESAGKSSSMLAMAGAQTATARLDAGIHLTAARSDVAKLKVSQALAESAAVKRAAARKAAARLAAKRRAAKRAAELRAQQAAAAAVPAPAASPQASSGSAPQPSGNPQQIAAAMLGSYGWSPSEFGCLVSLWNLESGWDVHASNPSGAYGIPQALPGSKMASAGPDWESNAATQIRWGLGYIKSLYGSPCGAWSHEQADGWY